MSPPAAGADEPYEFGWVRSPTGYEWVSDVTTDSRLTSGRRDMWLVPVAGDTSTRNERFEIPLLETEPLFRTFADIYSRHSPDDSVGLMESFRSFANRYGWLYVQELHSVRSDEEPDRPRLGESFTHWKAELWMFAPLVVLWDDVLGAGALGAGKLAARIYWRSRTAGRRVATLRWHDHWSQTEQDIAVETSSLSSELFRWLEEKPLVHPALHYLSRMVNNHLSSGIVPRIALPHAGTRAPHMRGTLAPKSLLQAMYLQLYWEIIGERRSRRCQECRQHFDATTRRSDAQTCSDRCRVRRHERAEREKRAVLAD